MSGPNAFRRGQFSIRQAAIINFESGVATDGNRSPPNQQTKNFAIPPIMPIRQIPAPRA
jgi:hypothetical protein